MAPFFFSLRFMLIVLAFVEVNNAKNIPKKSGPKKYVTFQGDMILTEEEVNIALNHGDVDSIAMKKRNRRGLRRNPSLWPRGIIPYDLSEIQNSFIKIFGVNGPTENAILNAITEIENKTCIRFVKRTTERDYVRFYDGGYSTCNSNIGRTGGMQNISIGFECFYMGVAMHEILHTLGFHHEQSRPDRDQYVEIIWDNIEKQYIKNFVKYKNSEINSLGSPYDYDSLMHYGTNLGSFFPWQETIRPKKAGVVIGQRDHLSKQDIWQINKLYNCHMNN